MSNGHYTADPTPEREVVVVLTDKISIAILSITWVLLLIGFLWMWRRSRRLAEQMATEQAS